MSLENPNVVLVRYSSDITLKSKHVRGKFEKALIKHIEFFLNKSNVEYSRIRREGGRVFIYTDKVDDACKSLRKVFGIVSISPVIEVSNDLDVIVQSVVNFSNKFLRSGMSFAVRVRRVKSYPYRSKDVEKILGSKILEKHSDVKVDLENPDITIYVEIRERKAYIFKDIYMGYGGMPYGVEGRLLSLLSGGVDSALAAWMAMKRGCMLDFVHFKLFPYYSDMAFKRFNEVIYWLKDWIPRKRVKVFLIDFGKIHSEIKEIDVKYRCILCKALIYTLSEKIAIEHSYQGLISGESIGQVASQTLDNLTFLTSLIKIPIFRPLIGFDKEEILSKARKIGLYEIAARDVGKCLLKPSKPATRIRRLDIIEKISSYTEYYGKNYQKYLEVKFI